MVINRDHLLIIFGSEKEIGKMNKRKSVSPLSRHNIVALINQYKKHKRFDVSSYLFITTLCSFVVRTFLCSKANNQKDIVIEHGVQSNIMD